MVGTRVIVGFGTKRGYYSKSIPVPLWLWRLGARLSKGKPVIVGRSNDAMKDGLTRKLLDRP